MTGFFPHQPPEPPEHEKQGAVRPIEKRLHCFVAGQSLTTKLFTAFEQDPTHQAKPVTVITTHTPT